MKILIIEDSDYKVQSVQGFLKSMAISCEIEVAKSFQTGKKMLRQFKPDVVLLDMTLPTSEKPDGQLEGRVRIFGGREILAEMEFDGLNAKVIVVTQFDHFGEPPHAITSKDLFQQLTEKYPKMFMGGIYYSNVDSSWQTSLKRILKKCIS